MAKATRKTTPKAGPKLRVYRTSIGFQDAFVAASSQKAALKAWGTTTDLFGAGRASVVEDPELQAEPLAHPGEVIKRMRGDAATLRELENEAPSSRAKAAGRKPKAAVRPAPPPPDRSDLDAAEAALAAAEDDLDAELRAIADEREALNARERSVAQRGRARQDGLRQARDAARAAYDRAVARAQRRR